MTEEGWTVSVTLTPTAATWLKESGELELIEGATGLPVRHQPRLPTSASTHPRVHCYTVVPATANTVAKLALGIADNQLLTQVCRQWALSRCQLWFFPESTPHTRTILLGSLT
jgi:3-polyprenyl-4-hydroxybenzoate decarboxylase